MLWKLIQFLLATWNGFVAMDHVLESRILTKKMGSNESPRTLPSLLKISGSMWSPRNRVHPNEL